MSSSTSRGGAHAFSAWQMPNFGDAQRQGRETVDVEKVRQQAYSEGFELGRKDGIESARQATAAEVQRFVQMADALAFSSKDIDQQISEDLASLAARIAEQLVQRELTLCDRTIQAVVERVIQSLPDHEGHVVVTLCPEDASALIDHVADLGQVGWEIREDPGMVRGDCRVEGRDSFIHATLESQIQTILQGVTGTER